MLSLNYHKLMEKTEEDKGKKYLMVDDYMLDKVLDKIKKIIGIEKFVDTQIFIGTDDTLPDDITVKNLVILIA